MLKFYNDPDCCMLYCAVGQGSKAIAVLFPCNVKLHCQVLARTLEQGLTWG